MSEILAGLLNAVKLAPRYLAPVGVVAGLLLFLPKEQLEVLSVYQFAQDNRPVIGLTFLFTAAALTFALLGYIWTPIARARRRRQFNRRMHQRLGRLSEDEKQILRFYMAEQTRSNSLRVSDGVVQGLVSEGIIYRSANMGDMIDGFAHNISEEAWNYLHEHQSLLQGSTNTYITHKRGGRF